MSSAQKAGLTLKSSARCFQGEQRVYTHDSDAVKGRMTFAVYVPDSVAASPPLVLYYLSGLTCTEQNVITKAGAQRICSELGIVMVCPDTSPRGEGVADDPEYDLGQGAGFYIDATEEPWAPHYQMESYITEELPMVVAEVVPEKCGSAVFGHSMGGHGALTLALRHPELYRSASAFAPICAPSRCPWGQKAFTAYLGSDRQVWSEHDTTELIKAGRAPELPIKIDQGGADDFLERELKPEVLKAACDAAGRTIELAIHPGFDHSYYFISTFMEAHLRFHHSKLL